MKKESNNERILVFEDSYKKSQIIELSEVFSPLLNNVISEWNTLGLGDLETENLNEAVFQPQKLYDRVVLALVPEVMEEQVGPFKKKVSKSLEGLELPDSSRFISVAEKAKQWDVNNHLSTEDYLIINEKAELKDFEKLLDSRGRVYATSEAAKEYYEAQEELKSAIIKFDNFLLKYPAAFERKGIIENGNLTIDKHFAFRNEAVNTLTSNGWENIPKGKEVVNKVTGYSELNNL